MQDLLNDLNVKLNKTYPQSIEEEWHDGENLNNQCHALFRFNSAGKVVFRLKTRASERPFLCHLPENLYIKLGFGLEWRPNVNVYSGEAAEYYPDLNAGIGSLFIYSDVMRASRFVGPLVVSLLRIITVSGTHDQITHYQPKTLQYFNLNVNHFSEVKIYVRDELGRPI